MTDKIEKIARSKSDADILDAVRAWCRTTHTKEVDPHTARRLVGGKQKPTKDIQERIKGKARFAKSVAGVQNLLLHDDGAFIPIRAEAPGTYDKTCADLLSTLQKALHSAPLMPSVNAEDIEHTAPGSIERVHLVDELMRNSAQPEETATSAAITKGLIATSSHKEAKDLIQFSQYRRVITALISTFGSALIRSAAGPVSEAALRALAGFAAGGASIAVINAIAQVLSSRGWEGHLSALDKQALARAVDAVRANGPAAETEFVSCVLLHRGDADCCQRGSAGFEACQRALLELKQISQHNYLVSVVLWTLAVSLRLRHAVHVPAVLLGGALGAYSRTALVPPQLLVSKERATQAAADWKRSAATTRRPPSRGVAFSADRSRPGGGMRLSGQRTSGVKREAPQQEQERPSGWLSGILGAAKKRWRGE